MNKKGQALVEFIVVLPVLIFIVMGIIDIGNIIYKKYQLENEIDYIADLFEQEKITEIDNYVKKNGMTISYNKNVNQITINLNKKVSIITPGLKSVLKDPYYVHVKRVMYDE